MSTVIDLKQRLNQLKDRRNQAKQLVTKEKFVRVESELLEAIIADLDEIVYIQQEHNKAIQLLMKAVTALSLKDGASGARKLVMDLAARSISRPNP